MTVKISHTADIQKFFEEAAGFGNDDGSPRIKRIIQRVLQDTARLIEDLEITEDEFWLAVDYLNRLGGRGEAGLLVAGLGLEHFLDLLQDAKDAQAGLTGAPRAPSKARCMSPVRLLLKAKCAWTTVARRAWPR